ncbi:uncharacterized [Tachysurus ichikawai]
MLECAPSKQQCVTVAGGKKDERWCFWLEETGRCVSGLWFGSTIDDCERQSYSCRQASRWRLFCAAPRPAVSFSVDLASRFLTGSVSCLLKLCQADCLKARKLSRKSSKSGSPFQRLIVMSGLCGRAGFLVLWSAGLQTKDLIVVGLTAKATLPTTGVTKQQAFVVARSSGGARGPAVFLHLGTFSAKQEGTSDEAMFSLATCST